MKLLTRAAYGVVIAFGAVLVGVSGAMVVAGFALFYWEILTSSPIVLWMALGFAAFVGAGYGYEYVKRHWKA